MGKVLPCFSFLDNFIRVDSEFRVFFTSITLPPPSILLLLSLFSFLSSEISEVEGLSYQVTGPGNTGRIQIGTPFYVTVTGRCHLGGFGKFNLVPINIRSQGAGVSEELR